MPSFSNLDESQATSLINTLTQQIQNVDISDSNLNNHLSQVNRTVHDIESNVTELQRSLGSINVGTVSQQFTELLDKFNNLNTSVQTFTQSQIKGTKDVVDQLGYINTLSNTIGDTMEKCKNTSFGDPQQMDAVITKLKDLKDNYSALTRDNNLLNIDQNNVDQVYTALQKLVGEMKDIGQTLDLGGQISQSINNPEILNNFKSMFQTISTFASQIPQNFQSEMKSSLDQVAQNSQIFSPSQQIPNPIDPVKTQVNIDAAVQKAFEESIAKISSVQFNAQELRTNADKVSQNAVKTENEVRHVSNNYDSYSYLEKKNMEAAGLNKEGLAGLEGSLGEILKMASNYKMETNKAGSAVIEYENAYKKYQADPTSQNLVAAQEAGKRVSGFATNAAQISSELNPMISTISKSLVAAYGNYDKLPEDVKKILDTFKDIEESTQKSSDNILNIAKDFPMQGAEIFDTLKEGIKESTKELSNMEKIFENMKKDAGSIFDQIKSGFSTFMGGVGNIGGAMRTMGLGVGIPLSGKEALGYIGDVTKYYKEFGQMDVNSYLAQYAQGSSPDQKYLNNNRTIGIQQYSSTNGIIGYQDYSNMSNSLMSGVQGHYGDGNNKANGLADMSSLTRTAVDLNKLYGVDSQGAISTFYKELNMDAKTTEDMMLRLADTAQSANIPVGDYVKTIANLALQFKDAGLSAKDVEIGMRNLTMGGLSSANAQSILSDTSGAMNKMSNSWGEAAYFGMQAGVSNNPFGAIKAMQDRWDPKTGEVKDSSVDATLGALDKKLSVMGSAWGTGDSKWLGIRSTLKDMGYSDKNASMLTDQYVSGDRTSFKSLMTKAEKEQEKPPGQQDLEDKLVSAGKETDELTKATIQNNTIQMNLAQVNKSLLDMIGKDLQKLVAALGSVMMTLAQGVGKLVDMLGGVGKLLEMYVGGKLLSSGLGKGLMKGTADAAVGGLESGGFKGAFGKALKAGGKLPIIGGLIDGAFTFLDGKGAGETTGYAGGEALGSGLGTVAGGWGGAAAGAAAGAFFGPVGALVGGLIGGIGGGSLGSWGGKKAADFTMDSFGAQKYENPQAAQNIKLTGNYAGSSTSNNQTYANNDFYGLAGVKSSDFDDNITKTDTILKNNTYAVQTDTNAKIDDMKTKQSNLLEKSNSINREVYDLNNSKYSDMIDKAKTQLEQLTNIAKITDSGFTFLDKILNDIYNKISSGGGGTGSGSSSNNTAVNPQNLNGGMNGNNKLGDLGGEWKDADKYDDMIKTAAKTYGVDPNLIKAVMMQESSGDKNAVSNKGAKGLMQITYDSAKQSGSDWANIMDPQTNINAGAAELAMDLKHYNGDITKAVAAYNAGIGAVDSGKYLGYGETTGYMKNVPEYYQKLLSAAGTTSANASTPVDSGSVAVDFMQASSAEMAKRNEEAAKNAALYANGSAERHGNSDVAKLNEIYSGSSADIQGAMPWEKKSQAPVGSMPYDKVNYASNAGNYVDSILNGTYNYSNTNSNTVTSSGSNLNSGSTDSGAHYSNTSDTSSGSNYQSSDQNDATFASAPVYVIGSEEYSNGAQKAADISKFHTKDDTVWVDNLQGQARGMTLYYDQVTRGQYAKSVDYADDYSTAYNSKHDVPNFNINIEANGDGKNYDAMAKQIQDSLTQIVQSFMGSSTNVAASNYQRTMGQY